MDKTFVKLSYYAFDNPAVYFSILGSIGITGKYKGTHVEFIDGMVLSPQQNYVILGQKTNTAPYTSRYKTFIQYYQSIPLRSEDYMTITDFYTLEGRIKKQRKNLITRFFATKTKEYVDQTVQIPLENAKAFFEFFHKKIAIAPLWLYPTIQPEQNQKTFITFRFNDYVATDRKVSNSYFTKLVIKQAAELKGRTIS